MQIENSLSPNLDKGGYINIFLSVSSNKKAKILLSYKREEVVGSHDYPCTKRTQNREENNWRIYLKSFLLERNLLDIFNFIGIDELSQETRFAFYQVNFVDVTNKSC